LGAGSLRDDPSTPLAFPSLRAWGAEVVDEKRGTLLGELGRAFSGVDRGALAEAPIEIVVEWNAELPSVNDDHSGRHVWALETRTS
jgi:hypothetical protein